MCSRAIPSTDQGAHRRRAKIAPPEYLKLIFSGKVLTDDQTLEGAGVKEGDFLVLMVPKQKAIEDASS